MPGSLPSPVTGIPDQARTQHLDTLLTLTQIPTAAGREHRVVEWIERWVDARPALERRADGAGNMVVSVRAATPSPSPVFFTAHLDHPAFVVERVVAPGTLELSFRGGVMDDYFEDARIVVHDSRDARHGASLEARLDPPADGKGGPFPHYLAALDAPAGSIAVGDVATWDLPPAEIRDGLVHTPVCDDLAAAAAALAAMDVLLARGVRSDVRLLFTRAEEVGFIGAIAACRAEPPTMARGSRVLALENSRAFPEAPIGGGPIVRVGDRISVFTPSLTAAVAKRAEQIAGGPATVKASQKLSEAPAWKWQRKLMPGGACEASVFCHCGYDATCLCLPLGNYHNMADLDAVQAGTNSTPAKVAREFISVSDFHGLVDLLVACGENLPEPEGVGALIEKLWRERAFALG